MNYTTAPNTTINDYKPGARKYEVIIFHSDGNRCELLQVGKKSCWGFRTARKHLRSVVREQVRVQRWNNARFLLTKSLYLPEVNLESIL